MATITITIPEKITQYDKLIAIPRKEYEGLLKSRVKTFHEVSMTKGQKKALEQARDAFKRGEYYDWQQLKYELERNRRPKDRKRASQVS